jgi:CRISPR-associated Csx10 family RAMP protein
LTGETAWWSNLYPAKDFKVDVHLIPLTALSCKRDGGFQSDDGHGVTDGLFRYLAGNAPEECPVCQAGLDTVRSFYQAQDGAYWGSNVGTRLIARTAVNATRGTAQAEQLYTLLGLNEGQFFRGEVEVPDTDNATLESLIANGKVFHIGAARSRGLGQVEVILRTENQSREAWPPNDLETRLERVDQSISAQALFEGRLPFVLTLESDAIMLNDYQQFQTTLTVETLRREARCWNDAALQWPAGLRLERSFAATRRVASWNAAHGWPRSPELAVAAGSAAVFSAPREASGELLECLKRLEATGLGERQAEGFGRVVVNHPFHFEEQWR